jgi:type VI secretion system protein ImpH
MAPESGHESASLKEQLQKQPYRVNFFQAVRLLQQLGREETEVQRSPIGEDWPPAGEAVRFRAHPSLSFPPGAISQLRPSENTHRPPEMVVSFLGMTGPSGVLPQHYTSLLLQRLRARDYSLRDFLDLFNHRIISLFFRAWEKYRFPFGYEHARREGADQPDLFTLGLYCLVGLGTEGLRDRRAVDDRTFLFYGGLFAHEPRPAVCLERMLTDYFGLPVQVQQFEGQWLYLSEDDRTQMGTLGWALGRNTELGLDALAGDRVWDVQSKVRLRAGPIGLRQFKALLPTGADWPRLVEMARTYVGPEVDFDVQLVLKPYEVPWFELMRDEDEGPRLGWNTWLRSHDFFGEVDDLVLCTESE